MSSTWWVRAAPWSRRWKAASSSGITAVAAAGLMGARNAPASSTTAWQYYHADHLGAPTQATDAAGAWVSATRFHDYGKAYERRGAQLEHGYAGSQREVMEELGLVRMGARWYAPDLGRWVSADRALGIDPKGLLGRPLEANLFSYAANSPTRLVDATGAAGDVPPNGALTAGDGSLMQFAKGFASGFMDVAPSAFVQGLVIGAIIAATPAIAAPLAVAAGVVLAVTVLHTAVTCAGVSSGECGEAVGGLVGGVVGGAAGGLFGVGVAGAAKMVSGKPAGPRFPQNPDDLFPEGYPGMTKKTAPDGKMTYEVEAGRTRYRVEYHPEHPGSPGEHFEGSHYHVKKEGSAPVPPKTKANWYRIPNNDPDTPATPGGGTFAPGDRLPTENK